MYTFWSFRTIEFGYFYMYTFWSFRTFEFGHFYTFCFFRTFEFGDFYAFWHFRTFEFEYLYMYTFWSFRTFEFGHFYTFRSFRTFEFGHFIRKQRTSHLGLVRSGELRDRYCIFHIRIANEQIQSYPVCSFPNFISSLYFRRIYIIFPSSDCIEIIAAIFV